MKKIIIPFVFLSLLVSCNETNSKKKIQKKEKTQTSVNDNNEVSSSENDSSNTNILIGTPDTGEPTVLRYWIDDSTKLVNDFTRNFEPVSESKNVNSKVSSKHKASNGKKKKRKFFKSIADLFKSKKPKTQSFEIAENESKEYTGTKGTYLNIPSNAFKAKDGSNITYPVKVDLEEYYNFEDFLFSNFSTETANDKIETAGTVVINAKDANDNELELKKDKEIDLGFPANQERPGMQLFNGYMTSGKVMKWKAQIEVREIIEDMEGLGMRIHGAESKGSAYSDPVYPGGKEEMIKYFDQNFNRNVIDFNDVKLGNVTIEYTMNADGVPKNIRVAESMSQSYANEIVRVFKTIKHWKPARNMGVRTEVNHKFIFEFKNSHVSGTYPAVRFAEDLKDKEVKHYEWVTSQNLTGYLFKSKSIGSINCDRLYADERPKNNFAVYLPQAEQANVKIYFKDVRGVLSSNHRYKTKQIFENVPIGAEIVVVATATINENVYLAVRKGKISQKMDLKSAEFSLFTQESFENEVADLEEYWGSD